MTGEELDRKLEKIARDFAGEDIDLYEACMYGMQKAKYLVYLQKGLEKGCRQGELV